MLRDVTVRRMDVRIYINDRKLPGASGKPTVLPSEIISLETRESIGYNSGFLSSHFRMTPRKSMSWHRLVPGVSRVIYTAVSVRKQETFVKLIHFHTSFFRKSANIRTIRTPSAQRSNYVYDKKNNQEYWIIFYRRPGTCEDILSLHKTSIEHCIINAFTDVYSESCCRNPAQQFRTEFDSRLDAQLNCSR
jgi:hypothetical protein